MKSLKYFQLATSFTNSLSKTKRLLQDQQFVFEVRCQIQHVNHCAIPESGPDMRVAEMRMASKEKEDEILHLMNTICMIQRERQSITEAVDKIQQQKFEELSEEYQTYQENTDKHIEDLQSLVEVKNKAGHIFVQ